MPRRREGGQGEVPGGVEGGQGDRGKREGGEGGKEVRSAL